MHQTEHVQGLDELEDEKLQKLKRFIASKIGEKGAAAATPEADFGLLIGALLPEHMVLEDEDVWEEDLLLTSVASDMQQETEDRASRLDNRTSLSASA